MKTSISVSKQNRDHLARIAREDMHGASMDEALKIILFERESARQTAALQANPEALTGYRQDMAEVSEQFGQVVYE